MQTAEKKITPTAPVQEGEILAGKYRIERVLGLGGMGIVVAARHVQLDQHVALKFLLPEALENKDVVARFAREARAAAKIQSDHIARIIDVGTLETGSPYMVMEYLDGKDLSHIIWERGKVPPGESVEYILQACEALAEAHGHGIIHRDLKPANLFLAQRPNGRSIVKVLDFGISKVTKSGLADSEDLSLTKTTTLVGSPLYMSPEQMTSAKHADARSDIWALGVILYELVTGQTPFTAESVTGIVAAILQTEPRPLHELNPDVPAELVATIAKCLEKDPSRRFQNVGELANALWSVLPPRSAVSMERLASLVAHSQTLVQGTPLATTPLTVTPMSGHASGQGSGPGSDPRSSPRAVTAGSMQVPPASQPISFPAALLPVIGSGHVTNPSWSSPQSHTQPSAHVAPKRGAMIAGILLGAFAMLGVLTFAAAFFLRSKAPDAPPPAPAAAMSIPANAAAASSAPAASATPAPEPSVEASAPPASPIGNAHPAATAHATPKRTPPKPSSAPAPAPTGDPKLDIRLTR